MRKAARKAPLEATLPISMHMPVLTFPSPTPTIGLHKALELAALFGAEVFVSLVTIRVPGLASPPVNFGLDIEALAAKAEATSQREADNAAEDLKREAHRLKLAIKTDRIRTRAEFVGREMALEARQHDFCIFSTGGTSEESVVAEALIFDAGRPVVLVPSSGDIALQLDTVAVAWDGSRAAARALHDSLPLLRLANRVVVLTAEKDKQIDPRSVEGVLALLDRHEIDCQHFDVLIMGDKPIGTALQEAALRKAAALLVMGGYGHSRLREFVLGGATRSVLENLRLPTLMSH